MRLLLFAITLGGLLLMGSCTKDDNGDQDRAASITFRTDSGFTWHNDTLALSDTIRVGVSAERGTDPLRHFYLSVSYDGAQAVGRDTSAIADQGFAATEQLIMRDHAGTEKWSFIVEEGDGDRTSRSLTFVVQ